MGTRTGSDSDSDSSSDVKKFEAAVDPDFKVLPAWKKDVGEARTAGAPAAAGPPKKSKRRTLASEWDTGHFVHPLQLTPASQEFVSKQLFSLLDKQIKLTKSTSSTVPVEGEKHGGIYLFHGSKRRLKDKDVSNSSTPIQNRRKKKKQKEEESDSEEDERLKAVAVSADWVMNPKTV